MTEQIPGAASMAMQQTADLDKRLSTHEAVCAERYSALLSRLGRVEKIMIGVAGAIIVGLVKLAFFK